MSTTSRAHNLIIFWICQTDSVLYGERTKRHLPPRQGSLEFEGYHRYRHASPKGVNIKSNPS